MSATHTSRLGQMHSTFAGVTPRANNLHLTDVAPRLVGHNDAMGGIVAWRPRRR